MATLLALGIPPWKTWTPTRLADGLALALRHEAHRGRTALVAVVLTGALLALALRIHAQLRA